MNFEIHILRPAFRLGEICVIEFVSELCGLKVPHKPIKFIIIIIFFLYQAR